ncbi:MAG: hypothetical protein B7Z78_12575 [Rhodospirillales bacterium 20-60-12]|nr:MAG: hypothetical protein B7Z78_12575 [Rhodospirillales bacterium 20-60-12]HQT67547.1 hypothetical protein [Acetobacteraceae bacterium]
MTMRHIIIAAPLLMLGLVGCAVGPSYATRMSQYIGAPEQTVVQQLGVPDKQVTVNGTKYLAYVRQSSTYIPGSFGFGYGYDYGYPFGPVFGGGFPPEYMTNRCETTFTVQNDHVTSYQLRGNACG